MQTNQAAHCLGRARTDTERGLIRGGMNIVDQKIEIDGKTQPHVMHRFSGPDDATPMKLIVGAVISARIDHVHIDVPQAIAAQETLAVYFTVVFFLARKRWWQTHRLTRPVYAVTRSPHGKPARARENH
jgi:hypothetical protein